MKNNLVKFLTPTFIAIILRLGLEFVFGINISCSDGWSFIWGCVAICWIASTILIGVMIMFETK
jgi:hypothetical protein